MLHRQGEESKGAKHPVHGLHRRACVLASSGVPGRGEGDGAFEQVAVSTAGNMVCVSG